MKEANFSKKLKKEIGEYLNQQFPNKYLIEERINLYYELYINNKLDLHQNTKKPKRGFSAFQVDLLISEKRNGIFIPKVVIELKDKLNTHAIITYSSKALRTKRIYPFLRYGIILFGEEFIPKRFFTHNEGFDFCVNYNNLNKTLTNFLGAIKSQLYYSDQIEERLFGKRKYSFYSNSPELD